jgi:uncharacterized protein YcaQ
MNSVRTISPTLARRLVIMRQRLAGPRPSANSSGIMDVMRDLGYVQLDPMRVVEQSHLLVLWSRLGQYDPTHLDMLLWKERRLFQDWAQATSIVLTEDYPIFSALKRSFATGNQPWAQRIRTWMEKNKKLRRYILTQLRRKGPMPSDAFEDKSVEDWRSSGWTAGRNVDMMLTCLWAQGKIMIAGRTGGQKLWDLTERYLPEWTSRERLSDREVSRRAAQKSLRALGVARATHIKQHYIRRCYSNLDDVLAELEVKGRVTQVEIREGRRVWRGPWYIHVEDQPLLDRLAGGEWEPRTTLLSPFDNLICDRRRTEQLFNFHFRLEVYVQKPKRKYGCYVMPILHGDRFIGRIDPVMNRKQGRLTINAVYAEPDAPKSKETVRAVASAIEELGVFLGAKENLYGQRVPAAWKSALRQ